MVFHDLRLRIPMADRSANLVRHRNTAYYENP